ncbi:MYB-like transcription factor ETC3 [Salvia splendens]|uniref:MYB-like transcription factor ETC3 n=1 Tax=Salvia splendens TaxID=180675 RepID=UPI001C27A7B2|nr:MYB-like transcription factor ETC3 [Salvia splendens]
MDKCGTHQKHPTTQNEASSVEWELIKMTEQEEDMICRMHKLVGDKWDLIAGRVPGRSAREIERFWLMRINGVGKNKEDKIIDRAPPLHIFD